MYVKAEIKSVAAVSDSCTCSTDMNGGNGNPKGGTGGKKQI